MRKGNSPNSKIGWRRGVSVAGAFKLDHLLLLKLIIFYLFFTAACIYDIRAGDTIIGSPPGDDVAEAG